MNTISKTMEVKFFLSMDEHQFQIVSFENCDMNNVHKLANEFIKKEQKKYKTIFGYKVL